jgi:hypothetical protein
MELLVTYEDVKNELGIDLASELGLQPREINVWLEEQQDNVKTYIAGYAYCGMQQVERYLQIPEYAEVIKKAILKQIAYLQANKWVEPDMLADKPGQELTPFIAPRAAKLLLAHGLLYTGLLTL